MEHKLTFDEVCRYAELCGKKHREGKSGSNLRDMTQEYLYHAYGNKTIMVLYQGERRVVRGKTEPEVCWICVGPDAELMSIPSRTLRMFCAQKGFGLTDKGKEKIFRVLNGFITNEDKDEISTFEDFGTKNLECQ